MELTARVLFNGRFYERLTYNLIELRAWLLPDALAFEGPCSKILPRTDFTIQG